MFVKMTELMQDDVINDFCRRFNQMRVQEHRTFRRKAPPLGLPVDNVPRWRAFYPGQFLDHQIQPTLKQLPGPVSIPFPDSLQRPFWTQVFTLYPY